MTVPVRPNAHSTWLPVTQQWFDLKDPDYSQVHAFEFPMAMQHCTRFSGLLPYGVGVDKTNLLKHSLLVADILEYTLGISDQQMIRTALMHDAHEVFCQDITRPAKIAMRDHLYHSLGNHGDYDRFEQRHMRALAFVFNLYYPHPDEVHLADNVALAWEMEQWYGTERVEAEGFDAATLALARKIEGTPVANREYATPNTFFDRLIGTGWKS